MGEWIKKMWYTYIYDIIYMWLYTYSGISFSCKKDGNPAIYINMDGPWTDYAKMLNEISQTEKDK